MSQASTAGVPGLCHGPADAVAWLEQRFDEVCATIDPDDRGVVPRQMFALLHTGTVDIRDVACWPAPHPRHDLDLLDAISRRRSA